MQHTCICSPHPFSSIYTLERHQMSCLDWIRKYNSEHSLSPANLTAASKITIKCLLNSSVSHDAAEQKGAASESSLCTILNKNHLNDFICQRLCCPCGGSINSSIKDFGCVARFSWKCSGCQQLISFDTADIHQRTSPINDRFVLATLATRSSYQQSSWLFTLMI